MSDVEHEDRRDEPATTCNPLSWWPVRTDKSYWEAVLMDPEKHGFNTQQAASLSSHFLSGGRQQQAQEEVAAGIVDWFDATLSASHWFSLSDVEPNKAAMLLCQFDPNDETLEQAQHTTTDVTGPRDLVRLVQRFEDLAKTAQRPRPLLRWLHEARQMGVRYHPWVDEYVEAARLETKAEPEASATPTSKPTQRRVLASTIQDDNIIAKLVEHGHDPLRMPKAPRGKAPWPIRERVSNELNYTKDVMKKAWTRLRNEGRIKDA